MKKKQLAILIGEIGFAIICMGGFFVMNEKQIQPTYVWEYQRDIPINTQVTTKDIVKVKMPASAVNSTFEKNEKNIIGKYVDTKVFVGERVLNRHLVNKKEIDPFESMDLSKLRKVSLPINYNEGFGGNIKRGDIVDLIYVATGKKNATGTQKDFQYAKTPNSLQGVMVYSLTTDDGLKYVDKTISQDKGIEGKQISAGGEGGKLSTITLAVTLEQAEEINARLKAGQLKIAGRFDKSQDYETPGYIVGEFDKIHSGSGLAESNK